MAKCKIREDLRMDGVKVPVETMDGTSSFIETDRDIEYEWMDSEFIVTIDGTKYRANSVDFEF